ncbi:hypothetical protein ABZ646_31230 [Streptomyces sp. NPDC007162]|uniref:hypothetical protein n=1 Tax=Streptomyces sp. NPDC007162 TaxID=3156917 RepID=UPI0033E2A7B1
MSRACARLAEIVATAAVFTAGCSFSAGGDRGQVPLDPRPLSAVLVTSVADTARLREQEESAVAHCMARRGFRYVPERRTVSERAVTTNPYGLLREKQAHQDGYGVVGEILSGTGNHPPAAVHHSTGWTKALEGTHVEKFTLATGVVLTYRPDGCAYRGRETAYGAGWNRLENELEGLQAAVMDRVEKDGRYIDALTKWSSCMRKSGYLYDDLQAPRQDLARGTESTGGSDRALRILGRKELRIASDDYVCERKVRLHETVYEVQRDAERSMLNDSARADLRRYQILKRKALGSPNRGDAPRGATLSADESVAPDRSRKVIPFSGVA